MISLSDLMLAAPVVLLWLFGLLAAGRILVPERCRPNEVLPIERFVRATASFVIEFFATSFFILLIIGAFLVGLMLLFWALCSVS